MKGILLSIILLLSAMLAGYCQEQPLYRIDKSSPLTLTIKSDKEVYKIGEALNVWGTIKNISKKPIWVCNYCNFIPRIKDSEGDFIHSKIIWKAKLIKISKDDFIYLKPEEELKVQVIHDGRYYFRCGSEFNLTAGMYTISLEYSNIFIRKTEPWDPDLSGQEFGINAWIGVLTSNTITIEVVENSFIRFISWSLRTLRGKKK